MHPFCSWSFQPSLTSSPLAQLFKAYYQVSSVVVQTGFDLLQIIIYSTMVCFVGLAFVSFAF